MAMSAEELERLTCDRHRGRGRGADDGSSGGIFGFFGRLFSSKMFLAFMGSMMALGGVFYKYRYLLGGNKDGKDDASACGTKPAQERKEPMISKEKKFPSENAKLCICKKTC